MEPTERKEKLRKKFDTFCEEAAMPPFDNIFDFFYSEIESRDRLLEAQKEILDKIKHGLQQMIDEAPNMLSPDGRLGERAEDRNHGIQQAAKLALIMVKLIEEKETEKSKQQSKT